MVEGCGLKITKFVLCAVNAVFMILGLAAIGGTAYVLSSNSGGIGEILKVSDAGTNPEAVTNAVRSAAVVVIVGGVCVFVVGALGCVGAWQEIKWCLVLYLIFLGVVVIFEVTAVALAVVFYSQVSAKLMGYWRYRITTEYEGRLDSTEPFSLAMDLVQVQLECCGVTNYTDFQSATRWNRTVPGRTLIVPVTCCRLTDPQGFADNPSGASLDDRTCPFSPNPVNSFMTDGCYDAVKDFALRSSNYVIAFAASILVFEVCCFIAAMCVCQGINERGNLV